MDWSRMFAANVVVLGCGNVLFGDDGLAPRAMALLAEEQARAPSSFAPAVAYVDAGTSIRPLLMDLALNPTPQLRKLIVVDVVLQEGRPAGSIRLEDLDACPTSDPAGGFLHHAPTWALLRKLRDESGVQVQVVTVQAARIPELMDDSLSQSALQALPMLLDTVRCLCRG